MTIPADDPVLALAQQVGRLADSMKEQTEQLVDATDAMRRSRRSQWIGLLAVAVVVVMAIAAGGLYVRDQQREDRAACLARFSTRDDVRSLAVAMVDEVAEFADVQEGERDRLIVLAEARALRELPPPEC